MPLFLGNISIFHFVFSFLGGKREDTHTHTHTCSSILQNVMGAVFSFFFSEGGGRESYMYIYTYIYLPADNAADGRRTQYTHSYTILYCTVLFVKGREEKKFWYLYFVILGREKGTSMEKMQKKRDSIDPTICFRLLFCRIPICCAVFWGRPDTNCFGEGHATNVIQTYLCST